MLSSVLQTRLMSILEQVELLEEEQETKGEKSGGLGELALPW